jgi:hypothetical protein
MKAVIRVYWPPKNLSEGLLRGQHGGVRALSLTDTLFSGAVFVKMWVDTHCRLEHILHRITRIMDMICRSLKRMKLPNQRTIYSYIYKSSGNNFQ